MILVFRFCITVLILLLLNQNAFFLKVLSCVLFVFSGLFSFPRFYGSHREKILGLLADKISYTCVLVALADLMVLDVILVAWIIGVVFLQTGVDLLQSSLKAEDFHVRSAWIKNQCYMVLTLLSLILFVLQYRISTSLYHPMHHVLSVLWFVLTVVLVVQAFSSDKLHKLMRDA
jgi:hypothetical protein